MFDFINNLFSSGIFHSVPFGIVALIIMGSSWCFIGLVMGDAPKKNIDPGIVQLVGALFCISVSAIILLVKGNVFNAELKVILATCGVLALGNIFDFFMLLNMSKAMQLGPNGLIWSIIQLSTVFQFIGGIVFFHAKASTACICGIVLLLLALFMFGATKDNSNNRGKWLAPTLLAMSCAAIQQNISVAPSYFPATHEITSILRALAAQSGTCFSAICYLLYHWRPGKGTEIISTVKRPTLWKYILIMNGSNLILLYLCFFPGIDALAKSGLSCIGYPLMVGACIVAFTLTSFFWLKEKISTLQVLALLVCIGGLVCLCYK